MQSLHWAQTKPQEQLPSAQSSDQQQVCDGEESTGTIQSQQPCAKHFDNIGWKSLIIFLKIRPFSHIILCAYFRP